MKLGVAVVKHYFEVIIYIFYNIAPYILNADQPAVITIYTRLEESDI